MDTSALPKEYLGGSENFTALGVTICGSNLSLFMLTIKMLLNSLIQNISGIFGEQI